MPAEKIRLSRLMSQRGLCSRREADAWIERGFVRVDGETISTLGTRIDPTSAITIEKEALHRQQNLVTLLLNKPVGYVSGQSDGQYPTASSLIIKPNLSRHFRSNFRYRPGHRTNLAPAGRLDLDSHGLLVLTQDGRIARRLIAPDSKIEKEYLVRIEGKVTSTVLHQLSHGLKLDGRTLKPVILDQLKPHLLRMTLVEGRKRQIRRMCDMVGLKVLSLKRVRIGKVKLGALPQGQWRYLNPGESF